MIVLYVVACSACFSFGAIFMAIFCVAGRSDEQALIDQNVRLAMRLARINGMETPNAAYAAKRMAAVARGDA